MATIDSPSITAPLDPNGFIESPFPKLSPELQEHIEKVKQQLEMTDTPVIFRYMDYWEASLDWNGQYVICINPKGQSDITLKYLLAKHLSMVQLEEKRSVLKRSIGTMTVGLGLYTAMASACLFFLERAAYNFRHSWLIFPLRFTQFSILVSSAVMAVMILGKLGNTLYEWRSLNDLADRKSLEFCTEFFGKETTLQVVDELHEAEFPFLGWLSYEERVQKIKDITI